MWHKIFWNSRDHTHGPRWKSLCHFIPFKYRGYVRFLELYKNYTKLNNMKKRIICSKSKFRVGDLYLFHTDNPLCPPEESLWGFYDMTSMDNIYLEHSTIDHNHFKLSHKLPKRYRFYRLATRSELRDYMYNLGVWEVMINCRGEIPLPKQKNNYD